MQHLHDEFRYPLNKKSLSDFLRREIQDKKLNQSTLANKIGVGRSTVHRWIYEKFDEIEGKNLKLLSKYSGIPLRECVDRFTTDIITPSPQVLDRFVQSVNRLDELVERMEQILSR